MRLDMSYVSIICGDGCQLTDSVETEEDITHVKYVESVLIQSWDDAGQILRRPLREARLVIRECLQARPRRLVWGAHDSGITCD